MGYFLASFGLVLGLKLNSYSSSSKRLLLVAGFFSFFWAAFIGFISSYSSSKSVFLAGFLTGLITGSLGPYLEGNFGTSPPNGLFFCFSCFNFSSSLILSSSSLLFYSSFLSLSSFSLLYLSYCSIFYLIYFSIFSLVYL